MGRGAVVQSGKRMGTHRRTKNLGTIERILRVLGGGAVAVWAVFLAASHGPLEWRLLALAIFALGADFVVTGIRGYCPLYRRLGWSTARKHTPA
jgi:hypothetical protein